MSLDGRKKAAIFVLSLGPETAAQALRCMTPGAVTELARAVSELEGEAVTEEVVGQVLAEFQGSLGGNLAPSDHRVALRSMLDRSLGPERGARLVDDIERERRIARPFADLACLDGQTLAEVLQGEIAQVQALVLTNVPPELAVAVLERRSAEARTDLLFRMAQLEELPPELALEVGAALGAAAGSVRGSQGNDWKGADSQAERLRSVASIVTSLEEKEDFRGELDRLRERDQDLADLIEENTLVFDDIALLDNRSLQKLLSQIDGRVLALTLKAADEGLIEKLLSNLSRRAREGVLEEKELLGPQPLSAVEEAQRQVLATVRQLIADGQLEIKRGKEDTLV